MTGRWPSWPTCSATAWSSSTGIDPFNFSEKCNAGALAASGEHLVFLNDDVEVIDGNWLEVLVGFVREPDVGAAGLRLLFSDGRLQHAGHVLLGGNPGHLMFGLSPLDTANRMALSLDREVAGVTAACLAIRRRGLRRGRRLLDRVRRQLQRRRPVLQAPSPGATASSCRPRRASTTSSRSAATRRWARTSWRRCGAAGGPSCTRDPYYNPNYGSSFDNYPFPLSYP